MIEYLSNCVNSYLPLYDADRHKIAFRNGVYNTLEDSFYAWGEVPHGTVACNFIDKEFCYYEHQTGNGQFWPSGEVADKDQDWWEEYEEDW